MLVYNACPDQNNQGILTSNWISKFVVKNVPFKIQIEISNIEFYTANFVTFQIFANSSLHSFPCMSLFMHYQSFLEEELHPGLGKGKVQNNIIGRPGYASAVLIQNNFSFLLCSSCRPLTYWWSRIQSLLYCSETAGLGTFVEESHSCTCPYDQLSCQGIIPCALGEGPGCAACAKDNATHCGSCNSGYVLTLGQCRPEVAESLEHYLGLETDLQDLELKYLLQKRDNRIEVHSMFISNDMRLGTWFNPSWRKRMLVTLKSNKYKPGLVHIMLALSLQICLTKNSTLEPVMAIYVNPFGGSHSESWFMPTNETGFPDWERTNVDASGECQNWTLTLGNKWKTFFETVHVYLRSRIKSLNDSSNETIFYEPLETDSPKNLGDMRINSLQVFGYSLPFESDAIRDLVLQLDYPYTQGSQDSAILQLIEIRDRVNRLSPPGKTRLDLFSCLLRHRLKLANNEVSRIQSTLQAFNAKQPNPVEYETDKLCS